MTFQVGHIQTLCTAKVLRTQRLYENMCSLLLAVIKQNNPITPPSSAYKT